MAGPARMSDVAKLAGVSTMTVSRVLNDNPTVSESKRQKVIAAVKELQYKPNELARSLRDRRSRQIGILVPYLFDPFFAVCAHAISAVAQQQGYSVVLSTSNEDPQAEFEETCHMVRRHVEGLIVIPCHKPGKRSLLLNPEFENLPIVTVDRPIEGSTFNAVLVENERGARAGTEHLIAHGHKRICFIGLSDELYTMHKRRQGYLAAMRAAGLRPQAMHISSSPEEALSAVRDLFVSERPPTALFCANNLTTRNVLHSLRGLKLRTPDSVALVGFDDFETADLVDSGITVVRQPVEILGRTAAELLFSRLPKRPDAGGKTVLPVELVVRGSSGGSLSPALGGRATSPASSAKRTRAERRTALG